jgi:hypothetical protein
MSKEARKKTSKITERERRRINSETVWPFDRDPTSETFPARAIRSTGGSTTNSQNQQLSSGSLPAIHRRALAFSIGRLQGNHHLQRLLSSRKSPPPESARIQRALPVPAADMPQFQGISDDARQRLIQLTQTYLSAPNVTNGQAVVDAVAGQLGGTVNYSQSHIEDSPEFLRSPSGRANRAAGGTLTGNDSGFAYTIRTEPDVKYKVEIYPRAFIGNSTEESLAYLMGVLVHEYIHTEQYHRQDQPGAAQFSDIQQELQAWAWQAQNIVAMGLSPRTMGAQQIISNIRHYYLAFLGTNPPAPLRAEYHQLAADACRALGRDPATQLRP